MSEGIFSFLKSPAFLKAILDHLQGFVAVVSSDSRVLFANKTLIRRTGFDPTGHLCYQAFHGLKENCPSCPREEVLKQKKIVCLERPSPLDNRWYSGVYCPFTLPNGEEAMLAVVIDVHEKKMAQEQAERQGRLLSLIFERSPFMILGIKPPEGEIVYVNPAFEEILGYKPEEVRGRKVFDFIAESDLLCARQCCREVFSGAIKRNVELHWRHRSGEKRLLQSTCFLVETPERGELVFSMSRDITEQKRLEEQFLQAQKMEAVGRLAGGIAHDFNNLLTSLKGYLQLLSLSRDQPEKIDHLLSQMSLAVERAAALTNQLLTFSRRQPEEPKIIDLCRFFRQMEDFLRRLLGEDVELSFSLPEKPLYIKVDEGHFQQIIMNLVVNARDAMPQGGRLEIKVRQGLPQDTLLERFVLPKKHYALISIADSGVGIPEEILPHIFDPFFTTKPPGKGTGLGLATVYSLIKQYCGHITVSSQPGQGTTFTILWPLASPEEKKVACPAVEDWPQGKETILLVEDDDLVRHPTAQLLRGLGYQVIEAANGLEALKIFQEEPSIDLVIIDLIMPQMRGDELARRLRELKPEIKILFSSGYPESETPVDQKIYQTDFLPKPYDLKQLAQKIRELLDR